MRPALGAALLGLGLLLVAGTFDAEPLAVCGAALLLLGAGAGAWVGLGARQVTVERELSARSVREEEAFALRIEARGTWMALPPGWLDEPLLGAPVRFPAGRRSARVRVEVTFARRGRRVLAPPALVLRDPLGLAQRVVSGEAGEEVLVLPRTFPVRAAGSGAQENAGRSRALIAQTAETEFDGLQPHREGAPASRIHWPTVARGAGFMDLKLTAEADSRPLVVLDARGPASPEALDAAVRAAGSLALHFARRGGCSLLLPGDRRAVAIERDGLAWPAAHVRLALVEAGAGPSPAALQNRRGLIVYVAARVLDALPRGAGRTPGGALLVVPGALPGRRPVFEVAGCRGYAPGRAGGGRLAAMASGAAG